MREPDRERLPGRTIVIEGPFQTGPERDDHLAQASIKVQGRQYRVAVVIPGQSDFHHFFGMTDEEREEARGWFALIELAECPTKVFESPSGSLAEVTVRIAQAPPLQIEDVLNYVHERLRGYVLERKGSAWQAQPPTHPETRPAARPQVQLPRLQPRPAAPGPRRNSDRGRKPLRPLKIIFDRDDDLRPPAKPGPKKTGIQTFWDRLRKSSRN